MPSHPRLILAPLLGVTTADFRRIFAEQFAGFDEALAPFVTTTHGNPPARNHFRDILPEKNHNSLPLIPQLIGKSGEDFLMAADILHRELGFNHINWNIGCPAPTVTAKARGAGLLPHPDLINAFLDTVFSAAPPYGVSLKMRLGFKDVADSEALITILNRYPLREVSVHARTAAQQYTGQVNLEAFSLIHNELSLPLIYNGDITSLAFAADIVRRFPKIQGLMIGRGAVADPSLPARIAGSRPADALLGAAELRHFHDALFNISHRSMEGGAIPVLGRMKELWKYWQIHFPGDERILKPIFKSLSLSDYQHAVDAVFPRFLT